MRRFKHSKALACLALAMAAVIAGAFIGRSAAYFTDTKSTGISFTFGNVAIVLKEPGFDPYGPPTIPNQEITKDPIIYNNGAQDCVVFVKITVPMETFIPVDDNHQPGVETAMPVWWLKDDNAPAGDHANSFNQNWILLDTVSSNGAIEYLLGYDSILRRSSVQIKNTDDMEQVALLDSHTTPVFGKIQLRNYLEGTLPSGAVYDIRINAYAAQAAGLADDIPKPLTADNLKSIWDAAFGG